MPPRDFTVRITAKGEIIFDMAGMTQEEIRLSRAMAEEMLGKIIAESAPGEPPPPGHVLAEAEDERERLRGR